MILNELPVNFNVHEMNLNEQCNEDLITDIIDRSQNY